ncbi:LRR receptor-like serine/threonine-protein kinase RGI2 [Blastocladiella emersonii ATCC 22665]|nr:LRR receptor-like serine/threonine-protein kinase RGI2 [Blastocladiella emersonii ATCC 22665]
MNHSQPPPASAAGRRAHEDDVVLFSGSTPVAPHSPPVPQLSQLGDSRTANDDDDVPLTGTGGETADGKPDTPNGGAAASMRSAASRPPPKRGVMAVLGAVKAAILRQWFLIGVVCAIVLGYLIPEVGKKGGYIHAEYTIKYGAVMVVFFLSGLGLKSQVLKQAFSHWRAHVVIQALSFGVTPALGYAVAKLMSLTSVNDALVAGFVVAVSMPTTISSNVIMTDAARGNEAVSLINATLGNILGIVVSPLLLLLYLGARTTINFVSILIDMPITVIGPLILGQLARVFAPTVVAAVARRVNFSTVSSCMLLLLVYSTFSDTFASGKLQVSAGAVLAVIGLVWVFYPIMMLLCLVVARVFRFARKDVVSIVFCGSTKTLSLGIPLIGIVYRNDPNIGLYSLPLLVYHATQLFIGGWAVPYLRRYVEAGEAASALARAESGSDGEGGGGIVDHGSNDTLTSTSAVALAEESHALRETHTSSPRA